MPTYEYIIAMDFECTCWAELQHVYASERKCEIIEFPAVLYNLKTGKVEAEFHEYLKPIERTKLSKYCIDLTGISQKTVDGGITLNIALKLFQDWLDKQIKTHDLVLPKTSKDNLDGNVVFVTWTDFDLGSFLHNECKRKKLEKPTYFNRWVDVSEIFRRHNKLSRAGKFVNALRTVGVQVSGRMHSGIDDARNLAAMTYKLVQSGATLKITTDID